jgi:glycosyltransferase involved in cell wall biosynthesis
VPFEIEPPTIAKFHDYKPEGRKYQRKNYSLTKSLLDNLINPSRNWVFRRYLKTTDHYIFNSDLCRKCWENNFDFPNSYSVVYNGVDTDLFYPREVDGDDFYLHVGSGERKGVRRIIEFAKHTDEKVVIIGNTEIPLPGNVENVNYVSQKELAELYSKAKATIHPANFEAFGNVILESLACGTPVVASPRCGASEILTPSTGKVTTDLREGVSEIGSCSSSDCVDIAHKYSWSNVADRTLELAKKVGV